MPEDLQPGDPRQVGPYRLVGRLGTGKLGQTFLGLPPGGRPLAVKVIAPELAASPTSLAWLRRAVAAARKVSGPFTANIADADMDGPTPWLAAVYVAGPSLKGAVDEGGPLPAGSVLALAAGLAEGLAAIHGAGLIHGELKPANVLLAEDGPRIADLGTSGAGSALGHWVLGRVFDSLWLISPERARDADMGPPGDVFNLGGVLAFAATGEGPFGSGPFVEVLYRVVSGAPPSLDRLPDELRSLVGRCLANDPVHRPTATDILAEVGTSRPGPGWLPESVIRAYARNPVPPGPQVAADAGDAAGIPEEQ